MLVGGEQDVGDLLPCAAVREEIGERGELGLTDGAVEQVEEGLADEAPVRRDGARVGCDLAVERLTFDRLDRGRRSRTGRGGARARRKGERAGEKRERNP